MLTRKLVGAAVALTFAATAIAPVSAEAKSWRWWHHHHHHHFAFHHGVPGGEIPALFIIGGVASTMINAAIVWNTQCRELTSEEAFTSFALPGLGIAFDASANKCKR